ncbi:cupredoxin, partial [Roseovarius atlanticus]
MKNLLLTTSLAIALSTQAYATGTHGGGHDENQPTEQTEMMVGMPGDPAKVDRTIDVTLLENDEGQMLIES